MIIKIMVELFLMLLHICWMNISGGSERSPAFKKKSKFFSASGTFSH